MRLLDLVAFNSSCLRGEVDTYLEELPPVHGERPGIGIVLYLPEGFVSSLVQFAFDDVDIVGDLDNGIHTLVGSRASHLDVETHDLEDEIEDVLEIQLCVADNFVVGIGKECT